MKRKTLRKLNEKKNKLRAWTGIKSENVDDVLEASYRKLGMKYVRKPGRSISGYMACASCALAKIGLTDEKKPHVTKPKSDSVTAFYRSHDWHKIRYDVLKASAGRCELCGRSPDDGAVLNVDHIKPVRKYWDLRLERDNLQVLCGACNRGKGNRDETDWRDGHAEPDLAVLMGERMA